MNSSLRTRLDPAVVFLVALGLRAQMAGSARFTMEEAAFFDTIVGLAKGEFLPLLGPAVTGGPAAHPGPMFYWLFAPTQWFGPSPESASLAVALLGAISVTLVWHAYRSLFGRDGALAAGLLLATTPWMAFFSDRYWNSNVFPFLVAMGFWGVVRYADTGRKRFLLAGTTALALGPQFHLSSPAVWTAFFPLYLWALKKYPLEKPRRFVAAVAVIAAALYVPYLYSELSTGFSNAHSFLFGTKSSMALSRRFEAFFTIPLLVLRFLTLDTTFFELQGYWRGFPFRQAVDAFLWGSAAKPFHWLRTTAAVASFGMAIGVATWTIRSWKAAAKTTAAPWRECLALGIATTSLLLAVTGKTLFPNYAHGLYPFAFAAVAAAWGALPTRVSVKAFAMGLIVLLAGAGYDASLSISRRGDGPYSIEGSRAVVARILAEIPPEQKSVRLESDTELFPSSYRVLARRIYGRDVRFDDERSPTSFTLVREEKRFAVRRLR